MAAKLTLTRCIVEGGKTTEKRDKGDIFKTTINPADYKHSHAINYSGAANSEDAAIGKSNRIAKYNNVQAETVAFTLMLDATGVVPDTNGKTIASQITQLKFIAYTYDGKEHEPNVVKITWGRGLTAFYGRMTSMNVDYTLFKADGTPLRAKVAMSFMSFVTAMEEALTAKRSSPDMTHLVRVQAGDTLPLLCQRIYRDPSRYREIAALNGLDGFRTLPPDTMLRFPPIR